ncbi:MAG: hypothetical protein WAK11_08475 [Candidatus Cybelea sp.]
MRRLILKSLTASSGFLEKATVSLSPGLNCIIGARGTCKSTVVESIRFAFDADQERVQEILADKGVIRETLGAGNVRCLLDVTEDGIVTDLAVEREIGDAPRILRNGKRDMIYADILDDIEIFSQGAIQRIASDDAPELRLQLIDRPNWRHIGELKSSIQHDALRLRETGTKLRAMRSEVEGYRLQLKGIEQVRAELARTVETRPPVPPSLEELHAQHLRRQRTLELLKEIDASRISIVEGLRETVSERRRVEQLAEIAGDESQVASELPLRMVRELQSLLDEIVKVDRSASALPVADEAAQLSNEFGALNEAYLQQRQLEQTATESLRREDHLRRQLAELEKAQRQLEQVDSQRQELMRQRSSLREHVASLREKIFELRVAEVDRINRDFGTVVLLTVKRATRSQKYVSKLSELMSGSRIRMQESIAGELASNLLPTELLEIVESADAQKLAHLLDRDIGQATRIIAYLRDHPDLYDLEGEWTDDSLEITMFDKGIPKSVEELSNGQKATALLPLILRESNGPLIVDQPEDDLDNSFIYTSLVKSILNLKTKRQLIFVTHNANIPVLGDAENIVVMHMEGPTKAGKPRVGTLEECKPNILDLLEGGREAFARREESYGSLLK